MTEQDYDDVIAPMLADVANKVSEMGGSIVARVEWEPGEAGITQIGIDDSSCVGQRLAQLAVHCRGNFDLLCIEAGKRFDLSQTVFQSVIDRMDK